MTTTVVRSINHGMAVVQAVWALGLTQLVQVRKQLTHSFQVVEAILKVHVVAVQVVLMEPKRTVLPVVAHTKEIMFLVQVTHVAAHLKALAV
ncbi:MAG: hypothetical protein QGG54_15920 [Gammaproteobacteria bacterium]|nr:hypothetical protein [Gammaproteobacteria bacterium]